VVGVHEVLAAPLTVAVVQKEMEESEVERQTNGTLVVVGATVAIVLVEPVVIEAEVEVAEEDGDDEESDEA
jgi:hypothetical protein